MTLYLVLFFIGFVLAVCLLGYASLQVAELQKKAEEFSKNLQERYSKPLEELREPEKKESGTAVQKTPTAAQKTV